MNLAAGGPEINPYVDLFGLVPEGWKTSTGVEVDRMRTRFPIDHSETRRKASGMPTKQELLDLQFIEIRHKLIEVAAFLDRVDRHQGDADHRLDCLKQALPILQQSSSDRAKAVLNAFSDHSPDLPKTAPFQGATGAPSLTQGAPLPADN